MPDARPRRLTPRVAAMLGSAGVLAVALSGCAGAPAASSTPPPTASASAAPIFASDEDALAAAEAAYGRYLEDVSQLTHIGVGDSARQDSSCSDAEVRPGLDSIEFVQYEDLGIHIEGAATCDSFRLVERSVSDAQASVVVYVCRTLTM